MISFPSAWDRDIQATWLSTTELGLSPLAIATDELITVRSKTLALLNRAFDRLSIIQSTCFVSQHACLQDKIGRRAIM